MLSKKYSMWFLLGQIKKIIQTDEEIGKVAAAFLLELFLELLLKKACQVTHRAIQAPQQFDFLKDLVASVPDMQGHREDNDMQRNKGPHRGQKSGSSGWKNGRMGSKVKDKKLSGMDLEQQDESMDIDTDGAEKTPQSPLTPFTPFTLTLPLPPALPGLLAPDADNEGN
ncbi:unnamed protein product [Nyctereutes procyonoides]|uniref:(raccoon dog) hypothetical protein n=1 Tax=Nyctereutes procyonoides TaxID=34880 RepID=A0A811YZX1_NYCPR|nr:unnamed protein product [Nyctereutes procyonoides]